MGISFLILINVHSPLIQLGNAVLLAFIFGQLSFFIHDLGHGQIVGGRLYRWSSIFFAALAGWSMAWWVQKHNQHHAYPNQAERDPDINFAFFAFSKKQAMEKKGVLRAITRHQAIFFVPILLGEAWNLRCASIKYLLHAGTKRAYLELYLIVLHVIAYGVLLLAFLPIGYAILFALIHWGLLGIYLGLAFAPNHKGMPVIEPGSIQGFVEQQLHTTRNMRGGWFMDMLTGGLNYQIEHHLWPAMPRTRLKAAAIIVEQFCRERGLHYHAVSVRESYAEIFHHFSNMGKHTA